MTDSTAQPNPGTSPRRSPLHDRHVALGAEMRDVGGHELPFRYSSELEEHKAVREAVGLFDLSLMGEIRVSGPDAARFLAHTLISAIKPIALGKAKYTMIVQEDGGIIDDLIVYRLGVNEFMLVHNARLAEKECGIPRKNIFVCDAGDIIEIDYERQAKKAGRIQVGGVMYDDSGAIVSEVVLKDRIHMSQEGMFVVVLTIQKGTGRLLTSPDIISRGFIYLRDSEELMNLIRQYLRQKMTKGLNGRYDVEVLKKEIKDEVTHILYDQTRRTPIVIPVINEIGLRGPVNNGQPQQRRGPAPRPSPHRRR